MIDTEINSPGREREGAIDLLILKFIYREREIESISDRLLKVRCCMFVLDELISNFIFSFFFKEKRGDILNFESIKN